MDANDGGPGHPLPGDTDRRAAHGQPNRSKQNPMLVAVLLAVIAGAVGVTVWQAWPGPHHPIRPRTAFDTVDDGATFFVDDAERLPPFDHGGRPAVRAVLFTCDGGRTRFVGYFEKLPEAALRKLVDAGRDLKTVDDDEVADDAGWLAKRPGDAAWANSKDEPAKYAEARKVACPGGGTPTLVLPEASN